MRHPAAWELAVASGPGQENRCTFADREYQRLEVKWRELPFAPKVAIILERHRKAAQDQKVPCRDLKDLPEGWEGLCQEPPQGGLRGVVVRAVKAFDEGKTHVLVETTIVWPGRRDVALEKQILAGVQPAREGPAKLWQAMGLAVELAREFDLVEMNAPVGKVEWAFHAGGKNAPRITVAMLAMPKYWLQGPLRDWLGERPPLLALKRRVEACDVNGHRGELVFTEEPLHRIAHWRGWKRYRLDVAWLCPEKERVYHVTCVQPRRDEDLAMPPSLRVECCQVGQGPAGGRA